MEQIKVDFYDFHKNKFMPIIKEFHNASDPKRSWEDKADQLSSLRKKLENELLAAFPFESDHGVYLSRDEKNQLSIDMPKWYREKLLQMAKANYKPLVDGTFQNEAKDGERHATTSV